MSNRLIKKYKYIGDDGQVVVNPGRLHKAGKYKSLKLDQYDPNAESRRQKKEASRSKSQTRIEAKIPAQNSETILADSDPQTLSGDVVENHSEPVAVESSVNFEERLRTETEAAHNKGFQEGRANGLAEGQARTDQVTQVINKVLAEFDNSSAKFFEEIEKVAIDMSVHLAKKIIGEAAAKVPDVIKTNVDKCINLLAGAGTVEIKINPADYDIIKAYLPDLDRKSENRYSFVLEPDQNVERGGCLVEFEGSVIDGRVETQFEKIKQHMEQLT
ncbi:MAG: hypothetical protein GY839_16420 [candidate division Zixibacteria bacterium]|nr:hypothetical protein [candidate division Zixibacteria bacterium]